MVAACVLALGLVLSAGEEAVLLNFYSESCGPCRQMAPVVQQLAARGYTIRHIDVSRDSATAAQFEVTAVPCFVMLVNGREVARQVGMTSQSQLERMLALGRRDEACTEAVAASAPAAAGGNLPAVRSAPALTDLLGQSGSNRGGGKARLPLPGWRMVDPERPMPMGDKPAEADLIAATVRIRVQHAGGQSCGSGTIIDARRGEALVLTCGHLFRESQGRGVIEVDIFAPRAEEKLRGTLVHFDTESDLGLVSIRPGSAVRAARVGPPQYRLTKGARVFSAGCDGGAPPTIRAGVITALDRFLGSPNLTATGLPVEGRSGGGLFSAEGYVIGVCNAALPEEKEGFYAALEAIHRELDRANLAFVYREPPEAPPAAGGLMVAVVPPPMPKEMPPPAELVRPTDLVRGTGQGPSGQAATEGGAPAQARAVVAGPPQALSPEEKATLAEIRRRRAEGAEVICVIRQRDKPEAPSEIVVLDRASPEFVRQLRASGESSLLASGIAPTSPAAGGPGPVQAAAAIAPASASPTAAVSHNASVASEVPEWRPRWLQPGYQGQ